ncbi:double zinc ribbon domain-containing protein [Natronobacterium texcoconense]|uniref:FHA domain-containing protein n=1 Tax=Natronobacterium texcoconense TaxID=1095778 RepID=A0A1H1GWK2_NATTX|nr:zinc ribbon domain-containing protein [Natronobacterium texcoconense]SDR17519.1 FHA domain-containing protein [Natronobacterium texcoconense]
MQEQVTLKCVSCDTSFEPGPNGGFCPSCDTPHPDYAGSDGDGDEEATEDDSESTGVEDDESEDVVDEAETDESKVDDDSDADEQEEAVEGAEPDGESAEDDELEEEAAEPEAETVEDDADEDELEEEAAEPDVDESQVDDESEPDQADETAADEDEPTADETCHSCGAEVDASMAFCPDCGAELEEDDEPELTACPSCENPVDDEAYCPSCGLHLDPIREGEESADDASTADVPEEVTLVINGEEYTFGDGDTFGRQDGEWLEDLVEASGGRDEVTYVSSEHLEFSVEDDGIYAVDVSTNGTRHNGTEIDGTSAKLEDGDSLELADRAELEVSL